MPCSLSVATALRNDAEQAGCLLDARLPNQWPDPELADFLPFYVRLLREDAQLLGYGVWLLIERESRTVVFSPADHPGLRVRAPRVWWPAGMGEQPLYDLDLTVTVDGTASDTTRSTFGIRDVRAPIDADGARQYRINGRPLLVNVWASWCPPCIEEMPELDRFARAQGEEGVQVLGLALDEREAVHEFLQRVPVHYPQAIDAPGPADAGVRMGNPKGVLPYSILVSADGRLLKQKIGPFEPGEIDRWAAP